MTLNLKESVLFIFIISLLFGDNYYTRLGISQSILLLPLFGYFLLSNNKIPKIAILRNAGFFMLGILFIQFIVFEFKGGFQLYRIAGGVILLFMLISLYRDYNLHRHLKWFTLVSSVPVVSFYLGFWDLGNKQFQRASFLYHDPNHLAFLLLFGLCSLLYFYFIAHESKITINKRLLLLAVTLYLPPILFTFSRTALLLLVLIGFVFLYTFFTKYVMVKTLIVGVLLFISFSLFVTYYSNSTIVSSFNNRFSEENTARERFYNSGFKLIGNNFFTGVGIYNYQNHNWRVKNGFYRLNAVKNELTLVSTASHNGFLDIFLTGGIGLFLGFCIIIIYPFYFMSKYSQYFLSNKYRAEKFLVSLYALVFIGINLTYSLYNSKIGWWAIGFSYIVISKYYNMTKNKISFNNRLNKLN
jgi:O-antigen ligase